MSPRSPHLVALTALAKRKPHFDGGSMAGALSSANGLPRRIQKKQIEHGRCDGCPLENVRCVVLFVGGTAERPGVPFLRLCASCWEAVFDAEISP